MTDPIPTGLPEDDEDDDSDDLENPGADPLGEPDGAAEALHATPVDDRTRTEALERRLVILERAAAEAADDAAEVTAAAAAEAGPEAEAEPAGKPAKYRALAEFVMFEFSPLYGRRRQGGRWRWCSRWWEHAEAVSRLGALHLAWEAMHDDSPTGLGDWYRNHLDHQLPILMGADGPFRRCDDHHYPDDPDDALICGIPHWDNIVWRTD